MEHRGIWTGLAVTLVAIGAGGLLGYVVTLESASPPRDVDWSGPPSIASWVCIAAGVIVLGLVFRGIRSDRRLRQQLNRFLAQGIDLMNTVWAEEDQTTMADWKTRAETWSNTVSRYLEEQLPEYSAVFHVEDAGQQFALTGPRERRLIAEWLDRRTGRLATILLKV